MSHRILGTFALVLLASALALSASDAAHATDYNPPVQYGIGVGPQGGLTQSQGTPLDPVDAANAWNAWTTKNKLAPGTAGCGSTASCIIYAYEGSTLYYTTCVVPQVAPYAATYIASTTVYNLDPRYCHGTDAHPLFVVALDTSVTSSSSQALKWHIARHEAGHVLNLGDAPVACWVEN
jgi:hypothetical protein